jgi:hypothetical protein
VFDLLRNALLASSKSRWASSKKNTSWFLHVAHFGQLTPERSQQPHHEGAEERRRSLEISELGRSALPKGPRATGRPHRAGLAEEFLGALLFQLDDLAEDDAADALVTPPYP